MSFCREYCLLAVLGVRVRFWLFRGLAACFTVVCLFYAVVCALCAWFRWFPSFICHFIVVWRLSFLRLLCAAVSALIVSFCRWFVFFAPIFLYCWCPFLYFFLPLNVVCWRFVFFCFKSVLFVLFIEFCVSWRFVLLNMSFFAVDYAFFVFFWRFFVRFESCLFFFRIACWVLHGLAACFA